MFELVVPGQQVVSCTTLNAFDPRKRVQPLGAGNRLSVALAKVDLNSPAGTGIACDVDAFAAGKDVGAHATGQRVVPEAAGQDVVALDAF